MIELNGATLTIDEVVRVCRAGEQAEIPQEAQLAINHSRAHVEAMLKSGEAVYGLTTGFGKFSEKRIADEDAAKLQQNLIISHACGTGRLAGQTGSPKQESAALSSGQRAKCFTPSRHCECQ